VAKTCLNVRFWWLESVLWAGIENYTIIIKTFTVCATGVATMFSVVYCYNDGFIVCTRYRFCSQCLEEQIVFVVFVAQLIHPQ
jgi:hypothetical protein